MGPYEFAGGTAVVTGAAVVAVGEAIRAAHPRLRLLVNNAGIALGAGQRGVRAVALRQAARSSAR
jgi:hypothetical protein